ncbi:MAG: hypothetical protein AAFZ65_09080, partial [Planctomycetota bacterium]
MLLTACLLAQLSPFGAPSGAALAPAPLEAEFDSTSVAVQLAVPDPDGVLARDVARRAGLAVDSVSPITSRGWTRIALAGPELDELTLRAALERLARDAATTLAAPVLLGAGEHWGAPTGELLVRLEEDERGTPIGVPAGLELLEQDFAGLDGL